MHEDVMILEVWGGTPARPDFGGVLSGRGVQNADPNKVC